MTAILNLFAFAMMATCAVLFFRLVLPFVALSDTRWKQLLLFGMFACTWGMIIWVGDPNLLYLLPFFMGIFLFGTKGDIVGRLAMAIVFFCLAMSTSALTDSYIRRYLPMMQEADLIVSYFARALALLVITLILRHFINETRISLSRRYWQLVLALALMPFCALVSVVLLTYNRNDSASVETLSFQLGLAVLPFVLLTSVVLLIAVSVLSKQEALEKANHLASQREVYYQSLRQQDQQLRQLRHDLRNHLTALGGLMELGKTTEALAYLDSLSESDGLRTPHRYCNNEIVNIVLASKATLLEQDGAHLEASVQLPEQLPFAEIDLCALLGNALDNAREGVRGCMAPTIRLRLRYDKGLLMLQVENPVAHAVDPTLATTKDDKSQHGFGIPGMRDIANRYNGSLEAGMHQGQFRLTVCLSSGPSPLD